MNCPSRRASQLFTFFRQGLNDFTLLDNRPSQVARSDYAINGGDYIDFQGNVCPSTLAAGDAPSFPWQDSLFGSVQTGISHQRSRVRMSDVSDGTSKTFLIGEKYIPSDHYFDGQDYGDNECMYCGDELDLIRWTGIYHAIGNLPQQDEPSMGYSYGNNMQFFGSPHANGLNMCHVRRLGSYDQLFD